MQIHSVRYFASFHICSLESAPLVDQLVPFFTHYIKLTVDLVHRPLVNQGPTVSGL